MTHRISTEEQHRNALKLLQRAEAAEVRVEELQRAAAAMRRALEEELPGLQQHIALVAKRGEHATLIQKVAGGHSQKKLDRFVAALSSDAGRGFVRLDDVLAIIRDQAPFPSQQWAKDQIERKVRALGGGK